MKKHIDLAIYMVLALMFGTGSTGLFLAAEFKLTLSILLGTVVFLMLALFFWREQA